MAMDNSTAQTTRDVFLKAVDITWTPDLEAPEEISVESLRHRGVDRMVLRFGTERKPKSLFGNLFGGEKETGDPEYLSTVTVDDDSLCLDQSGRSTTIALADIQAIEITEASRTQDASLRIETCRAMLRCGNGLAMESLQWLRGKLLLEAAGLVWRPIFNVGRRTTLKTVSPDFDTYMKWSKGDHPLFQFFFEEASKQASGLIAAVGCQDLETARVHADWLKSGCAVVGATYLSGLCQRIEVHIDNQEYDGSPALIENFEIEFNSVLKHLCQIADRPESEAGLLEESAIEIEIAPAPKNAKILLVEDSIVNQEIACALLDGAGHKTTVASSGMQALEILEETKFDLILMDCQMPGLSGIETTKKIRAIENFRMNGRTPIVALTANALKDDKKRCMDAKMDDYLSKPYAPHELYAVVNRWIISAENREPSEAVDAA